MQRPVWKVAAAKSARRSLKISFRTEYSGEGVQNARSVSSIRNQLKPFHLPEDVKYTRLAGGRDQQRLDRLIGHGNRRDGAKGELQLPMEGFKAGYLLSHISS